MIRIMARKNYSEEFRRQAVDLYESTPGATVRGIAEDLGIERGTLRHWLERYEAALPAGAKPELDKFVKDLGSGTVNLFKGPLNYQDGKVFVKAGETASDKQIWHMEQLLQGMQGQSSAKK